jgi:hypothetical protein
MYKNPGVYCLQETHDPDEYAKKRLNGNGFLYLKQGTNHKNGVALSIPNLNPNLTHQPSSVNKTDDNPSLIYALIKWFDLELLIVNIYAPSGASTDRVPFFKSLSELLDRFSDKFVVLAGDFNCVLNTEKDRPHKENKQSSNGADQVELENLILKHNLVDSWRFLNESSEECTFGRSMGNKTSRIDQIYISEYLTDLLVSAQITAHTASDHNICRITLRTPDNLTIAKSSWKLNNKVLKHRKYQNSIRDILTRHLKTLPDDDSNKIISWYNTLKYSITRTSRRYTIGNAHKIQDKIAEIREKIISLQSTAESQSFETKLTTRRLYYQLDELLNNEVKISTLNAKTTSADTTEQMTKLFFQSQKPKKQKEIITAIKTQTGIARTQTEITENICNFYEDLYKERSVKTTQIKRLLGTIKTKVQSSDYRTMNQPITPQEVTAAIRSIGSGKSPGPDGLSSEFYKTFAHDLAEPLAKLYQKFIETGEIPSSISNAYIHLLYKKGDPQDIGNWRPISLLNVDYKILAKIISDRMRKCLPKIIHSDQKGFVPSRRLEDAVIKATTLIEYCHLQDKPKYMLLLDQEKAFDRVSREYMHQVLKEFNFPPLIVNAVLAMYSKTTANISINGQMSKTIDLKSGVRQGCPLSPTLFALCIEPLGNLIREDSDYTGINIPNVGQFKISKYADDTIFFIDCQKDLDIILRHLKAYENATAAKANVAKTEILPIGPNTHSVENPLSTNITILDYNTEVKFLGVLIGNKVNTERIWDDKINKLETCLKLWDLKNLSYNGRVFVLRTQAMSSIWFQAKFHDLPKEKIKSIEKMIKNFVCKSKQRAPIKYNILKLPKDLGGLNVPDIGLQYQVLRTSWIKAYLDSSNKADWKPLANMIIDNITNTPGIGKDIMLYPKRYPKISTKHFWNTNLKAFKSLNGYITDTHDKLIYTPLRAMNESITAFTNITMLMKSGINTLFKVATTSEDGEIILNTPKTIKAENRLARALSKSSWEKLNQAIPKETLPPNYIFTEDEESTKIIKINQIGHKEFTSTNYRLKRSTENFDNTIFEQTDSPIRTYKRNKVLEDKEILVEKISLKEITPLQITTPIGPTENPVTRLCFNLGELPIYLIKADLSLIYDLALRKKMKMPHQHHQLFETMLETKPDWSRIPNRRTHQTIPTKTKDFRFLSMHNGLKIGKQLRHIPDIDVRKLKCHNCNEEENNIMHLLVFCPATNNAWNYVQEKWNAIIGSYEDFIDDQRIEILQYHKLFGIETPVKPKSKNNTTQWNFYVLIQTLDILLGNMQYLIVKQYKQYLFDIKRPNQNELCFAFENNMADAINKIYTRMNRAEYKNHWLFTRPRKKLEPVTKDNWLQALDELLRLTLINVTDETPQDEPLEMSSDLDQDDLLDNDS